MGILYTKPGTVITVKPSTGFKETQFYQPLLVTDAEDGTPGGVYKKNVGDLAKYTPYGGVYERPPEEVPIIEASIIESALFPVYWEDFMLSSCSLEDGIIWPHADSIGVDNSLGGGSLVSVLLVYSNWPDEDMSVSNGLLGGSLTSILLTYDMIPEDMVLTNTLVDGTLADSLIVYPNYADEDILTQCQVTGGTIA